MALKEENPVEQQDAASFFFGVAAAGLAATGRDRYVWQPIE